MDKFETVSRREKEQFTEDSRLVELARSGNEEAFTELVRRHRAKAFGLAKGLTNDFHLAEDIVQDALIRAFTHLGNLYDSTRFGPWLRTIVRNQAMMKLRRGGLYGKESPLSGLQLYRPTEHMKWDNLEQILLHLATRTKEQLQDKDNDPAELLIRKEFIEMIYDLLHCLNHRERGIFEAFFFKQLSPDEIASLFNTSRSYVYKTLTVSKQKVQRERVRVSIENHINMRRESGMMNAVLLEKPPILQSSEYSWATMNHCFLHALRYTPKNEYTLTDIVGLTGHAFRTTIEKSSVHVSGPNFYDWSNVLMRGLSNLGIEASYIDKPQFNPPIVRILTEAIELIQVSIDQGVPALVWNLLNNEYALVYGYDDRQKLFYAADTKNETTVPYDSLGQGTFSELFVITFKQFLDVGLRTRLKLALEMIIEHAHGGEKGYPDFAYGLDAYRIWIQLFEERKVDPLGNAYSLQFVKDAREFAVTFLHSLAQNTELNLGEKFYAAAHHATQLYSSAAEDFRQLCSLFPFPSGGSPNNDQAAEAATELLKKIKQDEEAGIGQLEIMLREVS